MRLVHVKYPLAVKKDRQQRWQEWRDGDIAAFLGPPLARRGFDAMEPYYNVPSLLPLDEQEKQARQDYGRNCMLFTTTRLPLNDPQGRFSRGIQQSGSFVERMIFASARKLLAHSSRARIDLAAEVECPLGRSFRFPRTPDARWRQDREGVATLAFQLFLPEIWEGGPDCLCFWAMSGPAGHHVANVLANRYAHGIVSQGPACLMVIEVKSPFDYLIPREVVNDSRVAQHLQLKFHRVELPPGASVRAA